MTSSQKKLSGPVFLGIEGGGTHTVVLFADADGNMLERYEVGPANLRLLSDAHLLALFKSIAEAFPRPDAMVIGLAGARSELDLERIHKAAGAVWPDVPCHATNDLETGLAAAGDHNDQATKARVLILSGTGSCCYGRNSAGKISKIGGWGHILGDQGSGYEIGLGALKAIVLAWDKEGVWPRLGRQLLQRLQLNEPNELIGWAQGADKSQIASLAVDVFAAWEKGDALAMRITAEAKETLARDAVSCAKHLAKPGTPVHFVCAGSILIKQPQFVKQLAMRLRKLWSGAVVSTLEKESVWGAVVIAQKIHAKLHVARHLAVGTKPKKRQATPEVLLPKSLKLSPTEQRNPRSKNLDKFSLAEAIELMLSEDATIPQAILTERKHIERAIRLIAQAFKHGGRLFYVGAGTSGRLGVLDASECPPTFRTAPELVQGIIAGGQSALWRSVEGAEDDPAAGARSIEFRGISRRDVVVGIAASGRTPFVWGALAEARRRHASTVLVGFNPFLEIPANSRPTVTILPNLGPEILTGSTRLKAGTATKLILNLFTTLAMVRMGKVMGNLMVDLNASNAKLRDRAVRIVQELRQVDYSTAQQALEQSHWIVKEACARLDRKKTTPRPARRT
ncbi:MAG: N-acetylmuramic acid 6-phosphate etherase [Pedosphaera sp.]|nr:N-acetylmuramic acid 6-phosphate etherase [Pedosphaera sp.]